MADFRIWGRIEQIAPSQFFVIASAVKDDASDASVLTATAFTADQANTARDRLMVELGAKVRARGDRVVDVED